MACAELAMSDSASTYGKTPPIRPLVRVFLDHWIPNYSPPSLIDREVRRLSDTTVLPTVTLVCEAQYHAVCATMT